VRNFVYQKQIQRQLEKEKKQELSGEELL